MGLNRYYNTGLHIGGLPAGSWSPSKYQELARSLWKGVRGDVPFAVIRIARDGEKFALSPFQDKTKASDEYGAATGNPQWAAYVAYFDWDVRKGEDELIDEALFQPTDVVKIETRTERVPVAVKAGLGLGALLGLVALIAKH